MDLHDHCYHNLQGFFFSQFSDLGRWELGLIFCLQKNCWATWSLFQIIEMIVGNKKTKTKIYMIFINPQAFFFRVPEVSSLNFCFRPNRIELTKKILVSFGSCLDRQLVRVGELNVLLCWLGTSC